MSIDELKARGVYVKGLRISATEMALLLLILTAGVLGYLYLNREPTSASLLGDTPVLTGSRTALDPVIPVAAGGTIVPPAEPNGDKRVQKLSITAW